MLKNTTKCKIFKSVGCEKEVDAQFNDWISTTSGVRIISTQYSQCVSKGPTYKDALCVMYYYIGKDDKYESYLCI